MTVITMPAVLPPPPHAFPVRAAEIMQRQTLFGLAVIMFYEKDRSEDKPVV